MNQFNLKGRRAVITGGAGGFRAGDCRAVPGLGRRGVVVGRQCRPRLADGARAGPRRVCPLRRRRHRRSRAGRGRHAGYAPATASDRHPVANAGLTGPNAPFWDYPADAWRRVIEVNLVGTFNCCRAIVPVMRRQQDGRDRDDGLGGGQGRQPQRVGLQRREGRNHRTHQVARERVGRPRHRGQLRHPGGGQTRIFDQMTEAHIAFMLSKIPRGRFLKSTSWPRSSRGWRRGEQLLHRVRSGISVGGISPVLR